MLFAPMEIPDHLTVIAPTVDWEARLAEILDEDDTMWELWTREVTGRGKSTFKPEYLDLSEIR